MARSAVERTCIISRHTRDGRGLNLEDLRRVLRAVAKNSEGAFEYFEQPVTGSDRQFEIGFRSDNTQYCVRVQGHHHFTWVSPTGCYVTLTLVAHAWTARGTSTADAETLEDLRAKVVAVVRQEDVTPDNPDPDQAACAVDG